ncbi:MAG: carboxypeptidase-like regulatory domain-containing protein [Bacteroides sp.]|nr:carboxypeptidase-like regulatory domain-containing protein [Bacteroides sp.]
MKNRYNYIILFLFFLLFSIGASAQIKGVITDSLTNEPLLYTTVQYEGTGIGAISNGDGEYTLEARKGLNEVTFSAIGYKTKKVKITSSTRVLNVKMVPDDIMLQEVVVKPQKEKYSRKNNPAVEFMKKVIEHKKGLKLKENDFYQYNKYEKMKMSLNDVTPEKMEKGIYKKFSFFKDQVETSTKTGKQILPISIKETASKTIYRKDPKSEKTIIEGMNSTGIEDFFNTGDMLGTILTDVFSDVNIYDDEIRLLQNRFISPIGRNAISFYKFYLMDTLMVDKRECVHLTFVPQNAQDFGFTGHLYVVKDSTYAVKKCTMKLPKNTGVNFVEDLDIVQEFKEMPDGNWVLTDDDMTVELRFVKGIQGLEIQRTTKYSNYSFEPIEPRLFRLKGSVIKEANMLAKSDEYWAKVRQVPLTKKESTMDVFMNRIEQIPGFKYVIFGAKALIENFVETGSRNHPSKFDFGPINTFITSNYVNGTRFRLSGMTTGNLSPHWSFSGYGAYGTRDKKWFYSGEAAYSFNKREYVLWEFPKHYISAKYTYDVMSPMDKYLATDKDNMFVGWKWTTVDQMSYIRDASINYELEMNTGFSVKAMLRHRNDQPAGMLQYWKNNGDAPGELTSLNDDPTVVPQTFKNTLVHDITTTEANVTLRYAPGETFVNTKQRRIPVSLDAPIFTLSHTIGLKGVLGGEYNFNLTEISLRKRFWFGSWGKLDITARAGAQWNTVPFPMLNLPMANLSYITQNNESFNLINNMEFLNDRYGSLALSYDMNGKLFNRIPLIKKLKWREMFRIRGLWGTLTDKNNPYKSNNPDLFLFPMRNGVPTSRVMGNEPYVEASVGIYNIFKLLHIEYVRRLTYTKEPGIQKDGIRFMILTIF